MHPVTPGAVIKAIEDYEQWRAHSAIGMTPSLKKELDEIKAEMAKYSNVLDHLFEARGKQTFSGFLEKKSEHCGAGHLSRILRGLVHDGKVPKDLELLFEAKSVSSASTRHRFFQESKGREAASPQRDSVAPPKPKGP